MRASEGSIYIYANYFVIAFGALQIFKLSPRQDKTRTVFFISHKENRGKKDDTTYVNS